MGKRNGKANGEDTDAKPADVTEQISQRKLKALLRNAADAYKDGQEIAGGLGGKIAAACEHDHLHRKAFSTLRAMDRMTPEKLADFWDTLQYYVNISGLSDRAKSAPRLAIVAGTDTEIVEAAE